MKSEEIKFMYLMVLFDLPMVKDVDKKRATRFRSQLMKDGFFIIQFSVYVRSVRGDEGVKKHADRITKILPETGNVRLLTLTESQYARMTLMRGQQKTREKHASKQLILL